MRFGRRRKDVEPVEAPVDDGGATGSVRIIRPEAPASPATQELGLPATAPIDRAAPQRVPEPQSTDQILTTPESDSDRRAQASALTEPSGVSVKDQHDTQQGRGDEQPEPDGPSHRGGDPLIKRPEPIDEDAVAAQAPPPPSGLGRNGVRVIPADGAGADLLDPTAPFDGAIGDFAAPGSEANIENGEGIRLRSSSPDAEGGDGRPTIVINDDGASAVATEPASGRARIDPKFRARRRAVRRSIGRRRMILLGAGLTIILVGLVIGALLGSPLFALRSSQIHVTGWEYADEAQMYAVLDGLAGTPVLRVDESDVEEQLEAVAWVEQATVDTKLPNSATIQIRERVPLATYRGPDGRFRILDREGRVLEMADGMPVEFMWITVSDAPDLDSGEFGATGIAAASELTRSLTPTIRSRVRRIAVDQSGTSLAVYLRDGTRVNFGAARDLFSKLVRLETLLTDFPGMTDVRIDVSTSETTRSSAGMLELTEGASDPPSEANDEPASTEGANDAAGDAPGDTTESDGN